MKMLTPKSLVEKAMKSTRSRYKTPQEETPLSGGPCEVISPDGRARFFPTFREGMAARGRWDVVVELVAGDLISGSPRRGVLR